MFFLTRNSCGNLLTIFYLIIFRVNYIQHTFKEPHATNNSRAPQLTFVQSNNIRIYIPVSEKQRVENKIVPSGHRCKTSIVAYRKSMTINKFMEDSKSYRQDTTRFKFFAECLRHSAKAILHSAKALPSVALGKAHTAKN